MEQAVMDDQEATHDSATDSGSAHQDLPAGFDSSVEAVLLSGDKAIDAARIAEAFSDARVSSSHVIEAVERLNTIYERSGRSFRIERVAGGFRVMTNPEYASILAAFGRGRDASRLSRAALETLSIVAYKQPITRAQLEAIRGVACGEVLRTLLDRKLTTITGRAEELGRPMLYGTTKSFLETFGLASVKDLPTPGSSGPLQALDENPDISKQLTEEG